MAFNDWNHDGKNDWRDNAIEYDLYYKDNESSSGGSGKRKSGSADDSAGCSFLLWLVIVFVVLKIIEVIGEN